MKLIFILLIALVGCAPGGNIAEKTEVFKEALLRTRSIYSVSRNMDFNNPLKVEFYRAFAGQLIELNMASSPMNTSFYSMLNSDFTSKRKQLDPPIVALNDLKIELDGTDVTDCLLSECNETKCHGNPSDLSAFTGNFNTHKLYINLTKLSTLEDKTCPGVNFNQNAKMHTLTLSERSSLTSGAKLSVNVIVYNRTYRPEDIQNAISQ